MHQLPKQGLPLGANFLRCVPQHWHNLFVDIDVALFRQIVDVENIRYGVCYPLDKTLLFLQLHLALLAVGHITGETEDPYHAPVLL